MQGVSEALAASDEVQQERRARAFIRHLLNRLPAKRMTLRAKAGCMNNGVSHRAIVSGNANWGFCHKSKNAEHLFGQDGRCVFGCGVSTPHD